MERAVMKQARGFTLIELVVVIAILGILVLGGYPSILNSMEVRALDNAARDIVSSLQQAKWLAVSNKINYRLRFVSVSGGWDFLIESENTAGTWTAAPGLSIKRVPSKYAVGLNLPAGYAVAFTPTGFVTGFSSTLSTITLTSAKLGTLNQPNLWTIRFFASGSFRLTKTQAG